MWSVIGLLLLVIYNLRVFNICNTILSAKNEYYLWRAMVLVYRLMHYENLIELGINP